MSFYKGAVITDHAISRGIERNTGGIVSRDAVYDILDTTVDINIPSSMSVFEYGNPRMIIPCSNIARGFGTLHAVVRDDINGANRPVVLTVITDEMLRYNLSDGRYILESAPKKVQKKKYTVSYRKNGKLHILSCNQKQLDIKVDGILSTPKVDWQSLVITVRDI